MIALRNLSFTDAHFSYLTDFIAEKSGVFITRDKEYLLNSRLSPVLKAHNLSDLEALISALKAGHASLKEQVINAMMTHETFFFRDQKPFDAFQNTVFPALIQQNEHAYQLRIWCVACSSGQECYSLAMILKEYQSLLKKWTINILGTDISAPIIEKAREGLYSRFEIQRGLPPSLIEKYFHSKDNQWQVDPSLQSMIKFQVHNILDDKMEQSSFDVIFCRNMLIYFDQKTKQRTLSILATYLKDKGYLFLGGAETTLGISTSFKPVESLKSVYTLI